MKKQTAEKTEQRDIKGKKLVLNKETVRSLSEAQLSQVAGGRGLTDYSQCC